MAWVLVFIDGFCTLVENKLQMSLISIQYYQSAFGELILGAYQGELCLCDWRYRRMRSAIDERIATGLAAEYIEEETAVINETIKQLEAYSKGELKSFDVPLKLVGTPFQQQVWKALIQIPYGQTKSYLGLSQQLGNEKAIRAVASANGANAISIIVPCHRIIGNDGALVGYAGGLPAKKKLLDLEGYQKLTGQLSLF